MHRLLGSRLSMDCVRHFSLRLIRATVFQIHLRLQGVVEVSLVE
jgi:hypothetical protein